MTKLDSRRGAALVLVVAWLLAVAASAIALSWHVAAANLITAFLLWRIWCGATWSRTVLVTLSAVSGGFAAGIGIAILAGATGMDASAVIALLMYAGVGVLLSLPTVRGLARPTAPRSRHVGGRPESATLSPNHPRRP